jgi:quinol monooxygenase YgiN
VIVEFTGLLPRVLLDGECAMKHLPFSALAVALVLATTQVANSGEKGNPILDAAKANVSDPNKPFTMIVILSVKDGEGKAVEAAFLPAIKATRNEKGCIAYDLNRDLKEPTRYYVYERWQSVAALERHLQTEHIKTLLDNIRDRLAGAPEAKFYAVAAE